MYQRLQKLSIKKAFFGGKVIVVIGARQVGKTTLVNELLNEYQKGELISFNCDYLDDRDNLDHSNIHQLKKIISEKKIVFIDEAQKVYNIGETLKILVDSYKKDKQIIVTGSSRLNLLDQTQETLTGRKKIYNLFPLSIQEIKQNNDLQYVRRTLNEFLTYGTYPEIVTLQSFNEKRDLLEELSSSYLYKDIFEFEDIRKSAIIDKLIKLLALQIASEVSYSNLSRTLGVDVKTVEKYVGLLEKANVIKLLAPYSFGGKREVTKKHKLYFVDLGIRNALLNNFNDIEFRVDKGQIWENFVMMERFKYIANNNIKTSMYFWRTYDGAEVDLVESRDNKLYGYEFKYQGRSRRKPKQWLELPNSSYKEITVDNFDEFLC